ncbi:hypothetical protein EIP86_006342 [Pleurotus ostreatoroseus]|nr:hypothetical protein EIP86_006342 [Pleurotus ostreatoroseus]
MNTNSNTQQLFAAAPREDSRSTGRWLTSNDALDWTNTAINALATVGDGINVPYLKLAANLTKQLIEVIQVEMLSTAIETSGTNKTFEYTRIIIDTYKRSENQEPGTFDANVEQFNKTLEEILGALKKIALRKLVKRVVRHQKDKRRIADAKTKLEHSFRRFNLANEMIMVRNVQEIQVITQEARAQTTDIAQAIPAIQESVQVLVLDTARVVQVQLDTTTRKVEQGFEHMRHDILEGHRLCEAQVSRFIEQTQGNIQQVAYSSAVTGHMELKQ